MSERFTQLAKLSIDRSADRLNSQLTYFFSFKCGTTGSPCTAAAHYGFGTPFYRASVPFFAVPVTCCTKAVEVGVPGRVPVTHRYSDNSESDPRTCHG